MEKCAFVLARRQWADIHKRDMNGDTLAFGSTGETLVSAGGCSKVVPERIYARNGRGETPMMAATRNANHAVLELLSNPRVV